MLEDIVSTAVSPLAGVARGLGLSNEDQIRNAQDTLDAVLSKASGVSAQNRGLYGDYYNQMQSMYGEGASAYSDAVKNLADAIGNYKDFAYTGKVEDFLDPARNQRVAAAMDAINNSASAGGSRFSSNYLDKLAQKQAALASEEWKSAYDRLQADRANQLQEWQTGQTKINNLGTLAGIYGNDRTQLGNAIGEYYSALAGQNNADLETYSDVAQSKANLESQKNSGMGGLLSGVGSIIGGLF